MNNIKEIGFIVYAVTDIPKARAFYEGILGLKPSSDFAVTETSSWVEYNIGAHHTLSIGCSPDWKPSKDGAVAALEVTNFETVIKHLKERGAVFFMEPQQFPTCSMAVIVDPDENKLMIHQRKAKTPAKAAHKAKAKKKVVKKAVKKPAKKKGKK
jgi:predicted enzyme related to lactoylglutathione lyase